MVWDFLKMTQDLKIVPPWFKRISKHFPNFDPQNFSDLVFICKNGEKVFAHKFIIALVSQFIKVTGFGAEDV